MGYGPKAFFSFGYSIEIYVANVVYWEFKQALFLVGSSTSAAHTYKETMHWDKVWITIPEWSWEISGDEFIGILFVETLVSLDSYKVKREVICTILCM